MARERILVSLAIETTRKTIFSIFTELKDKDELVKANYYSFLIKFLHDVTKLSDIVYYAAEELNKITKDLVNYVSMKSDPEEVEYSREVYPLCRSIEALGTLRKVNYNTILMKGIDTISNLINSDYYYYIDDVKYAIPILQASLGASLSLRNIGEYRKKLDGTLTKLEELRMELDPSLRTIYGKDIYFSTKLYRKEVMSERDFKILRDDLRSRILIKILKATEYITAFEREPPAEVVEFLIRELPKFFGDMFRLINGKFEYYSTLVESIYNLLRNYNNKDFASALFRILIDESDWIINEADGLHDSIKLILGTSLLVASKSAIHR